MKRVLLSALLALALGPGRSAAQSRGPVCPADNAGLTLPAGFCALVVADSVGRARHLVVAPNGDVFVALRARRDAVAGVLALRDTTGDGVADVRRRFGPDSGGTGIALHGGYLYFATDNAVLRWVWGDGQLEPVGPPDTIVRGLVSRGQHASKAIAIRSQDTSLFVNIGAPSNACQEQDRTAGSKGMDPCPLLAESGGIWRFHLSRRGQTQADGERFASGLRNTLALAVDPATGVLFGAQHGRDQLNAFWPALYTAEQSAEKPAEELFLLVRGGDYGWPYCYYDAAVGVKLLAPEYGGDGRTTGRCTGARAPAVAFPAHWAPEAILFYTGSQFPPSYRGGMFVSFHGSWNRAPLPQAGFNVSFVGLTRGRPTGSYTVFADGFAGADKSAAAHRPMGLALGPDGSLYVSDDAGGRIYRILFKP
ncbi:MAG: PQQ-dependent sugar dehydrogenase [Gemmatimonadales bacterium]